MSYRLRVAARWLPFMVLLILMGLLVSSCLATFFNQPPKPVIAIAEGSPYGTTPLTITFDISGSYDPDGTIISFRFDFGDGSTPIDGANLSQPIEHTYDDAGQYLASLTVTDNTGEERRIQTPIIVSELTTASHCQAIPSTEGTFVCLAGLF